MKKLLSAISVLILLLSLTNSVISQPVITSIPVTTAVEGELYNYTVHASGNQAGMQYSLINHPAGMTVNPVTGLISWTPVSNDVNAFVEIVADNGIAPSDTQKYFIFIAEAPSCSEDLIAVFRLDESSGPLYEDVTGTHNANATVSPVAVSGKINGAQVFGDDTRFLIPDIGTEWDWSSSGSFTLECWVKTSVDNVVQAYISRYNADPDVREISTSWWLGQTNTGNAALEIKDFTNHNSVLFSTKFIADGQWHHVVGVRNSATQHNKIYVDGEEVADMSASLPGGFSCPQPTPVTLGYMKRTYEWDPEYHLNGSLDEVAFYSRALTAEEIAELYNEGQPSGHCGPGNYAPVITSSPSLQGFTENQYTYSFEVQDIDNATVSISAISIPSWLNFNYTAGQKTALISGVPASENVGEASVVLRVSDGHTSKDQTFIINVTETNHLPQVSSSPVTRVKEDIPYSYQLVVNDADELDDITITAVDLPDWLTFSTENRTAVITGTPGNLDCGTGTLEFMITDGRETIHYTYELVVEAVNDPPVITSTAPDEVDAGTLYSYILTAEDEDSETLTMSVLSKPEWLSFSTLSGLLYGSVPLSASGSVLVTLRVSDGSANTDQYIVININSAVPVQQLELSGIQIYPVPAGESLRINCGKLSGELSITVYGTNGVKIKSLAVPSYGNPIILDTGDLSNGCYLLEIRDSSALFTTKFTVLR